MNRKYFSLFFILIAFLFSVYSCKSSKTMVENSDIDIENSDLGVVIGINFVEEKPLFQGKNPDESFRNYVNSNIRYPIKAAEKGITGRVIVEFIIEKDGSVSNAKVVQSAHPLLDNEVLGVITRCPKWSSGKHFGEPVRVSYQFPFIFALR